MLYPWRRIFQQMFNHDRMAGPLYCMREGPDSADHAVITELGARCRAIADDYASWQAILMHTLDMQVCTPSTFPLTVVEVPQPVKYCASLADKAFQHRAGSKVSCSFQRLASVHSFAWLAAWRLHIQKQLIHCPTESHTLDTAGGNGCTNALSAPYNLLQDRYKFVRRFCTGLKSFQE